MQRPNEQDAISLRAAIVAAVRMADAQQNTLVAAKLAEALDAIEKAAEPRQ